MCNESKKDLPLVIIKGKAKISILLLQPESIEVIEKQSRNCCQDLAFSKLEKLSSVADKELRVVADKEKGLRRRQK